MTFFTNKKKSKLQKNTVEKIGIVQFWSQLHLIMIKQKKYFEFCLAKNANGNPNFRAE